MRRDLERRLIVLEGRRVATRGPILAKDRRDEMVCLALLGPMPDLSTVVGDGVVAAEQRRAAIAAAWRADH